MSVAVVTHDAGYPSDHHSLPGILGQACYQTQGGQGQAQDGFKNLFTHFSLPTYK